MHLPRSPTQAHASVEHHTDDEVRLPLEARFERDIQKIRREEGMEQFSAEEQAALLSMLRAMLAYKPADRVSAAQLLSTEWMEKYGLPALQDMGR